MLTPRQIECLQLTADGREAKEIAYKWRVTYQYIRNLKMQTFDALGVETSAHAVAQGLRRGLIS